MARNYNSISYAGYAPKQRKRHSKLKVVAIAASAAVGAHYLASPDQPAPSPDQWVLAGSAVAGQALADEHALAKKLHCTNGTVPNAKKSACTKATEALGKLAGANCLTGDALFCNPHTKTYVIKPAADGETVAEWKQRVVEATNPHSQLFKQLCVSQDRTWVDETTGKPHVQVNCEGLCAYLQGALWGYKNTGWDSAQQQWNAMVARGEAHPGDRHPPVGALLFYKTDNPYGHVASYFGNDEVVSTDVMDNKSLTGGVYIVRADALEGAVWDLKQYEGWAPNIEDGSKFN